MVFKGDKTVTIDANPMHLVQWQYSIECTRGIGFASIVTIFASIKTKVVQFPFNGFLSGTIEFRPLSQYQKIRARAKCHNVDRLKLDRAKRILCTQIEFEMELFALV